MKERKKNTNETCIIEECKKEYVDDMLSAFSPELTFGWRLKHIRGRRNMTQRELGLHCGFPVQDADKRIRQYESNSRRPKENIVEKMASKLGISQYMLSMSTSDIEISLFLNILWADIAGIISVFEPTCDYELFKDDLNEIDVKVNSNLPGITARKEGRLLDWLKEYAIIHSMYENAEISYDEYSNWRYMWQPH